MSKEQNFISAVVYLQDDSVQTLTFFKALHSVLETHFKQYEIIAVNSSSASNPAVNLRQWAETIQKPLTIVNMSLRQTHEQCMNAGLDISIGDYVYEFDSVDMPYEANLIWEAYETAMKGNDIVTVCPKIERRLSRLFYRTFNAHSNAAYKLRTDAFRLVSRRALNRAHAISENLPYRKATYAACGLKMAEIEFEGKSTARRDNRLNLATDSLVLYTDFGYSFSIRLTFAMLLLAVAELIYTVAVWVGGDPISGWTTTMFVLTVGLTGLFAILAIMLKYMTLLLDMNFRKQSYLVEGIEKL